MKLKKNVRAIWWLGRTGRCITIEYEDGSSDVICHPVISEVIMENPKTAKITELHRLPPDQEISIEFEKPVPCKIEEGILRCKGSVVI